MREILFRGKSVLNGEWLFGNLLRTDNGVFVIQNFDPFGGLAKYEVDHNTICQYTGLTDKNGRKIFEGDIVKVQHTDGQEDYTEISEVSLDEKNAGFSPWNWQYQCDGCDLYCETQSIEVIGNIFDNPELIGEQT